MKIKVYLSIGYSNASREDVLEIPDEELEGKTEEEKEDLINEYAQDWANEYIEIGWEIK